ncbi:hypothetical protein KP509_30G072500 [Ceratopteris richardii]|uniref:F-box domain-containing protein n=1 Tax=Ceratopteris richardii TaxID=49495 RepID=A0A8T2R5H0_CERRI|nr:hypothetical protein KP509_30G072500 [Ceratopteris richardii]
MDLPLPLLEDVLASLPLRSLLAVSATSKYLHSLVSSSSFALIRSHSAAASPAWFFFFGFNWLLPERSQAFAFDPVSSSWLPLPLSTLPPHNSSSLSVSAGGCFVALAGAQQTYVCIAPSLVKQDWQVLKKPMRVPRRSDPLLGVFYSDPQKLRVGRVIVAGGVDTEAKECDGMEKDLAVEEYNTYKEEWDTCQPLPEVLKGKSLVATVAEDKFYVGDAEGSVICWMEGRQWREAKLERPGQVRRWEWVACEGMGLLAVAECDGGGVRIYRLEGVDADKQIVQMVSEMPDDLCALFEEEEGVARVRSCTGGPNLVYIYSDSGFREYAICACELSTVGGVGAGGQFSSRWFRLPPLPLPLHRFDRVCCISACVPLRSCISSE